MTKREEWPPVEARDTDTSAAVAAAERARLRAILDVLPAGVALYDATGELVEINPEGQRLTQRVAIPGETPEDRQRRYVLRRADGAPMTEEESPSGRSRRGETFSNLEF
ncbi:MAG TPA: PAS domain-containing protein, partial [Ktedonobacterales bacterium]|nr:PAS domain-containing protein [Ktedonobacterales bacterium]